jgi:hypothetical protein
MFEKDYRQLVERAVPSDTLVLDTLSKMRHAEENIKPIRRVRGTAVLTALLLLGVIGASAIALGSIKVLNWKGEDVTEEMLPDYNTSTAASPGEELAWQFYEKAPADEYWTINFENNHYLYNIPKEAVSSVEELENRIAASGSRFLIPRDIPEGYTFKSAEMSFRLTEKTIADGFAFLDKEVMGEGVTVYKYRLPDSIKENIAGYEVRFQKGGESYLYIRCDLGPLGSKKYFYLHEDEASGGPVVIKGMRDGLYLQNKNWYQLHLRTMYLPNEKIIAWPDGELPDSVSEMPYMICNTQNFSIDSNDLDKDQLIKVAQGLR